MMLQGKQGLLEPMSLASPCMLATFCLSCLLAGMLINRTYSAWAETLQTLS